MSKHKKSKKAKYESLDQDARRRATAIWLMNHNGIYGKLATPETKPNPRNYKDADWSEVG